MPPGVIERDRSLLVVIDVQEKLLPVIQGGAALAARIGLLLAAARELAVPVVCTEQYPRGLGPTVAAVRDALPAGTVPLEKTEFSCAPVPAFRAALAAAGRDTVVLAGIEAHVCLAQTALDLAGAAGARVWVVADATGSRRAADREVALARLRDAGVGITTAEAVVFEWLRRAGTPEFKSLSARVKALDDGAKGV